MAARGGAAGACQEGEGIDQHEDGHKQAHAGEGIGAAVRDVADVDPVDDVVKQTDDLGHHGGDGKAGHKTGDPFRGHGAGIEFHIHGNPHSSSASTTRMPASIRAWARTPAPSRRVPEKVPS